MVNVSRSLSSASEMFLSTAAFARASMVDLRGPLTDSARMMELSKPFEFVSETTRVVVDLRRNLVN